MSALDWAVLIAATLGIAGYGWWQTRGPQGFERYVRGDPQTGWLTIGLSVMATQASAITFLSTPGQGYADGMRFVQMYFGLPIAMVIIAAVFLPRFRRLKVLTAYEFLGQRFDGKTRLLGASLFLVQRGLGAGLTIYAPSIIIASIMGWSLNLTIVLSSILVIVYTVSGGNEAVNVTQKFQMLLIFSGLIVAFLVIAAKMPAGVSLMDAVRVAGISGRLKAIDYSADPNNRYTLWSGLIGGTFLALAYFGSDQSQVQRYLSGKSLRQSRLGLVFNGLMKIPMQVFILFLGTLVFAFYQFERPPLFFNQVAWRQAAQRPGGDALAALENRFDAAHAAHEKNLRAWLEARHAHDPPAETAARAAVASSDDALRQIRSEAGATLVAVNPKADKKDADYVFLTFVMDHLPHGVIGLLVAVIFAGGLSSVAGELTALGATMTVDFYRGPFRPSESDAHYVAASKWFTALWGLIALAFAFFCQFADNLIQAVNLIGSIFYGPTLGLFVVAFFLKRVGGNAVFWGAALAEALVIAIHFTGKVAFLWYNPIGVGACVLFSGVFQMFCRARPGFPEGSAAA
ncbi:MAG TPA: sodium:solute symporter [Verrucomicrobiae bacterium]|nr:sodium:solute symporter [Verrucomicrobiae bacterium]